EQPLHLSNFIPQENLDKFRQVLNTLTPQKSETSFDMQLGDTFLGWRVNAIFDPDNKINHYTFIGREITEKIREQQKLEQNALIDPLTGLYNRRYLYEQLDNFGNSGEIKGVTIVMFDADNFKNINDSLGHDKGDEILCQVANILKKNTHSTDIIGRWGGDEFLGIFPNLTDPDDVQKLLFHLNNSLLENNLHVSFGFSIANRNGSINPLDLKLNVALADKSLYEIKPNKNLLK
ncbi:MAG: GGDEF domain-containing protein, partial [Candidatus Shapirobacteria bacterium]